MQTKRTSTLVVRLVGGNVGLRCACGVYAVAGAARCDCGAMS